MFFCVQFSFHLKYHNLSILCHSISASSEHWTFFWRLITTIQWYNDSFNRILHRFTYRIYDKLSYVKTRISLQLQEKKKTSKTRNKIMKYSIWMLKSQNITKWYHWSLSILVFLFVFFFNFFNIKRIFVILSWIQNYIVFLMIRFFRLFLFLIWHVSVKLLIFSIHVDVVEQSSHIILCLCIN